MAKIQYEDKVALRTDNLPRKNRVTAEDLIEIKESVNWLYDNPGGTLNIGNSNLTTSDPLRTLSVFPGGAFIIEDGELSQAIGTDNFGNKGFTHQSLSISGKSIRNVNAISGIDDSVFSDISSEIPGLYASVSTNVTGGSIGYSRLVARDLIIDQESIVQSVSNGVVLTNQAYDSFTGSYKQKTIVLDENSFSVSNSFDGDFGEIYYYNTDWDFRIGYDPEAISRIYNQSNVIEWTNGIKSLSIEIPDQFGNSFVDICGPMGRSTIITSGSDEYFEDITTLGHTFSFNGAGIHTLRSDGAFNFGDLLVGDLTAGVEAYQDWFFISGAINLSNSSFNNKISTATLTANRTIVFPDKDGIVALETGILAVDYGVSQNITSSTQIFTTGIGTGSISIDLDNSISINSLVFISDLANDASSHNIIVDSGVGSTILKGDGTPPMQTFTIDSSGQSYTLRKMTSTQWMIVGTNQ